MPPSQSDAQRRHDDDHRRHHDDKRGRSDARTIKLLSVALIVMSGLLVITGLYAAKANNKADTAIAGQRTSIECVTAWATAFEATTQLRVDATGDLDRAKDKRDNAVDDVLAVVIGARKHPPQATDADFSDALRHYGVALKELRAVQAKVHRVRNANPYPPLHC